MDNIKALRGLWGANAGPKMPYEKRMTRRVMFINLAANKENEVKGWKAHR